MTQSAKPRFFMPAEWETHRALWLAWPHDEITFPNRIRKVEGIFVEIIKAIHESEKVELLVLDEDALLKATGMLQAAGADMEHINFHIADYADVWLRDTGPTFIKDKSGKTFAVKWLFNAWGGKFPELLKDGALPRKISAWTGIEMLSPRIVMEGGAIDVNGSGVCLTTAQCLLNKNRNPGMTRRGVEEFLREYLGIQKTVWLEEGLINDHTDGHIDELARFVSVDTIVCAYEDSPLDGNYHILKANYETLRNAVNQNGKPFNVVKLPMPRVSHENGEKMPASYANFYVGNKAVLVPIFNDPNDGSALDILTGLFPKRRVVGIDCSDVIYGGGTIHCMTQQQPE